MTIVTGGSSRLHGILRTACFPFLTLNAHIMHNTSTSVRVVPGCRGTCLWEMSTDRLTNCSIMNKSDAVLQASSLHAQLITAINKVHIWQHLQFEHSVPAYQHALALAPLSIAMVIQTPRQKIAQLFSIRNLAIASRSRVSCAHNTSKASIVIPRPWNLGHGSLKVIENGTIW